jgi:phosphoglucosamine mutase
MLNVRCSTFDVHLLIGGFFLGRLFGTDGIRGRVNHPPMTAEMALRVGKAAAIFFQGDAAPKRPKIVIAKDTRLSGSMIEAALVSGLCSLGADVYPLGVFPTPGVACLTTHLAADAGIVVSASHNPFYDNGIKFFNNRGFKLPDAMENDMEAWVLDRSNKQPVIADNAIGRVFPVPDADKIYGDFLLRSLSPDIIDRISGRKVVLDCSNGATSALAPNLFSRLGVDVIPLSTTPDGININDACGSQYPETLAKKVLACGADVGFAFDGDGDRVVAVDETGNILTGDQLIAIFSRFYLQHHLLTHQTVVTTVMSNMGLGRALSEMGVTHLKSAVGDRYVMEQMVAVEAVIGGEDSGHIIFLDAHTTGDGILAALQFLRVMVSEEKTASRLAQTMTVFPQVLMNVAVKAQPAIGDIPGLAEAIETVEHHLGDTGRVLVRYSGTQPMCRVMVEASTKTEATRFCGQLAEIIHAQIG